MIKKDLQPFMLLDEWQAPFLRREINDQFDIYFEGNGYYPNDGNFYTDIRLNLQVSCDASNRVSSMSYYKVHDLTMGHGKPVLRDAELSAKDKSVFSKALSACTTSTADSELSVLLDNAGGKKLPGGWTIKDFNNRRVVFVKSKDCEVSIPRSRICKAIDISHNYLEILTLKEFWLANQDCLRLEDADPLLSLFSLVDPTHYYEYEMLRDESEQRIQESEVKARFGLLKVAATEGNTREINKQIKQIPQDKVSGSDLSEVLCIAIKHKNEPMARLLLKYGADVNINHSTNGKIEGPLFYALDNEWYSFFLHCIKQYFKPEKFGNESLIRRVLVKQRPDLAFVLLKHGCGYIAFTHVLSEWKASDLQKAVKIPGANVQWTQEALQELKDAGEAKLLRTVLAHLSNEVEHLRGEIVRWLFVTGDLGLMDIYMQHDYAPLTGKSQFKLYNSINPVCYTKPWLKFYCDQLFGDSNVWNEFILSSIRLAYKQGEINVIRFIRNELADRLTELHIEEIQKILEKM